VGNARADRCKVSLAPSCFSINLRLWDSCSQGLASNAVLRGPQGLWRLAHLHFERLLVHAVRPVGEQDVRIRTALVGLPRQRRGVACARDDGTTDARAAGNALGGPAGRRRSNALMRGASVRPPGRAAPSGLGDKLMCQTGQKRSQARKAAALLTCTPCTGW
jgi:hypothetical protein